MVCAAYLAARVFAVAAGLSMKDALSGAASRTTNNDPLEVVGLTIASNREILLLTFR